MVERQEYLYRDKIAELFAGLPEFAVRGKNGKTYFIDVLTKTQIIEIKYARGESIYEFGLKLEQYAECLLDRDGIKRSLLIYYIFSLDPVKRRFEQAKVKDEIDFFRRKTVLDLEVSGEIEQDVKPIYKIAGLTFQNRKEIAAHLEIINCDFKLYGCLSRDHRLFFAELAKGGYTKKGRFSQVITFEDITATIISTKRGEGMQLFIDNTPISPHDLIAPFCRVEHYKLLTQPALLGVSQW